MRARANWFRYNVPHVEAIFLENVRRRYAVAAQAQNARVQHAQNAGPQYLGANANLHEWLGVNGRTETSEHDEGARRTEAILRTTAVSSTDAQAQSKGGKVEGGSANHAVAGTSTSDELTSAAPAAATPKANARDEESTARASAPAATAATDAHVQDPTQEVAGGDSSRAAREQGANEPQRAEAPPLPPHWHEGLDHEGRRYFWNRRIGVSQWARPVSTTSTLLQHRAETRHQRISHLLGLLPRYGHREGPDMPTHRHDHLPGGPQASPLLGAEGYGLHLANRLIDDPAAATPAELPHGAGGAPGATAGGAGAALGGSRLSRFQPRASADGGVGV